MVTFTLILREVSSVRTWSNACDLGTSGRDTLSWLAVRELRREVEELRLELRQVKSKMTKDDSSGTAVSDNAAGALASTSRLQALHDVPQDAATT